MDLHLPPAEKRFPSGCNFHLLLEAKEEKHLHAATNRAQQHTVLQLHADFFFILIPHSVIVKAVSLHLFNIMEIVQK